MKAGQREWIGLGVLALPTLLVTADLSVLFLAVPKLARDLHPEQHPAVVDHRRLRARDRCESDHDGNRRRSHRPATTAADRRRRLRAGVAARSVLDKPEHADRGARATGHRRRDARALLARTDPEHVPDPEQRQHAIAIWISCFAAGAAIGPLLGGALLQHSGGLGVPRQRPRHGPAACVRPVAAARVRATPTPAPSTCAASPSRSHRYSRSSTA